MAVAFDAPILVDHNVNFAAFAESREGAASHFSSFVYLLINADTSRARPVLKAFGASLFLKGEWYRGVPIQHRVVATRGSALDQQAVALGEPLAILDEQFESMLRVKTLS